MSAIAVYPPSGSSGELQFVNSSGQLDAAQAFWDTASAKLFISGSLETLGTHTVIDTTHLQIEDTVIGLGSGSAGQGSAGDRGLIFLISGETNPSLYWDESGDEFRLSRVTNTPGDSIFNDPEAGGEGGYQNLSQVEFLIPATLTWQILELIHFSMSRDQMVQKIQPIQAHLFLVVM